MKVLLAVNLAETEAVTREVSRLVNQLGAELFVLHVMPPHAAGDFPAVDPLAGLGDPTAYALLDPAVERDLEQVEESAFASFISARFDQRVNAAIKRGYPAETILEDADEHDVDLIIVGKRHHGRIEKFLMGDVARDVVEKSSRPVLLMPLKD